MIVLTVVLVCLLHMCNKNYRGQMKAKKLKSFSNTTESTNSQSISMDKSGFICGPKSNIVFKERAYLSKGVPVILYEEMSDKPIDDYDENNRDIIENNDIHRSIGSSSHYRSPLIMRNEKPPMPAPPEYTKQPMSYLHKNFNEQNIVGELNSIFNDSPSRQEISDESAALMPKSTLTNDLFFYQPNQTINLSSNRFDDKIDELTDKNIKKFNSNNNLSNKQTLFQKLL